MKIDGVAEVEESRNWVRKAGKTDQTNLVTGKSRLGEKARVRRKQLNLLTPSTTTHLAVLKKSQGDERMIGANEFERDEEDTRWRMMRRSQKFRLWSVSTRPIKTQS